MLNKNPTQDVLCTYRGRFELLKKQKEENSRNDWNETSVDEEALLKVLKSCL